MSIQGLLDQNSLKWIFVGGKGGVGKTTNSSAIAIQMASVRRSVLILSTDPAHNLSDAFDQKFSKEPTLVHGFTNLYAMEVDPTVDAELQEEGQSLGFLKDLTNSIPGIDEAMSFGELMRLVKTMDYEVIIFDTAPTGHTLRLLSFPAVLEKGLTKLMQMKSQFGGMMGALQGMLGGGAPAGGEDEMFSRLESMKELIQEVNDQFRDAARTTFVCVCIAEFLSLYETERLVQELFKQGIDAHVVLVNQLLQPPDEARCRELAQRFGLDGPAAVRALWEELSAPRLRMQAKYVGQIDELYEDFDVVKLPLMDQEVRGVEALRVHGRLLLGQGASPAQ